MSMSVGLPLAGLLGLGGPEMFLIFGALLLLFGGAKLPKLARGMGQSIREFKKATEGHEVSDPPAVTEKIGPSGARASPPPEL